LGAFFTNLQVHRPGPGGAAGQDGVVRALREHLGGRYADAAAGEEPDRVILVGPPGAGGWVPVFDEESEGQDETVLHDLARPLSRDTGSAVVTVLVHDSDVAYLRLFERGEQVDSWVSDPGWGGQRPTADQRRAVRGQPARWAGLLAGGATEQDLQRAWKARPVLAEHSVSAVARLLGMDEARAATGYRYLTQEGVPAGFVRLALRLRERPPDEGRAIGPPAFRRGAYFPTLELAVGELLALSLGVRNAGGESRGILVAVWGEALARGGGPEEPLQVHGLVALPVHQHREAGDPAAVPQEPHGEPERGVVVRHRLAHPPVRALRAPAAPPGRVGQERGLAGLVLILPEAEHDAVDVEDVHDAGIEVEHLVPRLVDSVEERDDHEPDGVE
jgi:hypothetical protein